MLHVNANQQKYLRYYLYGEIKGDTPGDRHNTSLTFYFIS